jgi:hypothetical protein
VSRRTSWGFKPPPLAAYLRCGCVATPRGLPKLPSPTAARSCLLCGVLTQRGWKLPPPTAANVACRSTRRGLSLPPSTAPHCTTVRLTVPTHNCVSWCTFVSRLRGKAPARAACRIHPASALYAREVVRHTRWGAHAPTHRLTRCCARGLAFLSAPAKARPTSHVCVGRGAARPRTCARARVWCPLAGAELVEQVASLLGRRGSAGPGPS